LKLFSLTRFLRRRRYSDCALRVIGIDRADIHENPPAQLTHPLRLALARQLTAFRFGAFTAVVFSGCNWNPGGS
jgi:hypothetical protein